MLLVASGCFGEFGGPEPRPQGQEGDPSAQAPGQDPAGPLPPAAAKDGKSPTGGFKYYDVNHVLSTGQSLAVGTAGSPALSKQQPYDNLRFIEGLIPHPAEKLLDFAPLDEDVVETMSSGMANLVTKLAREQVFKHLSGLKNSHDLLVSCHGKKGAPYAEIKKGTAPYKAGIKQVMRGKAVASSRSKSYVVRAVTLVHGEADHKDNNKSYTADLLKWQADYEADVKAITGQSESVPLFQSQISNWTAIESATSHIPMAQLAASKQKPDKVVLVGPKYFLLYVDGLHLRNEGYRHMGEYYAKAYRRVVLEGKRWQPLMPTQASLKGNVITVDFQVPVPPLVLDTQLVSNPGNYGFEYWDDTNNVPEIAKVALVGPTTVQIVLTHAPTNHSGRVRYAFTGIPNNAAGPFTGPRGNLRDSDATKSRHGSPLFNWCVHFDVPVVPK